MNAATALSRLRALGVPVFSTSNAAIALGQSPESASQTLCRLRAAGVAFSLRKGLWTLEVPADPMSLLEDLTAPYPAYVSLFSAMYLREMMDQVPRAVYAVSPGRGRTIRTPFAEYRIHHLPADLFEGYEYLPDRRIRLATAEKALFDFLYLSCITTRLSRSLPELDFPRGFRAARVRAFARRIPTRRLRGLVEDRFEALLRGRDDPGARV